MGIGAYSIMQIWVFAVRIYAKGPFCLIGSINFIIIFVDGKVNSLADTDSGNKIHRPVNYESVQQ